MSKDKILGAGVVVAIVLAITGLFFPKVISNLAAPSLVESKTTVLTQLGVTDGLIVGTSGSGISQLISGTCNLISYTPTLSATSSLVYGCAATGVQSTDRVFVTAPKSNTGVGAVGLTIGGIVIRGASASTTSGFIEVELANFTGAATSSFPNATTSIQYWAVRN